MTLLIKLFLISSLGLGTTLTFMSSHWLLAWIGLEINTLAILPLMAQRHHPRATEAATKYLLIQAASTAMLLYATTFNAWSQGEWNIVQINDQIATTLIVLALAMKLGLAPFHFWLPEVMQGLTLITGLILATWQKLAPLALLLQISHVAHPLILTALGITSTLMAGWAGMNQTQLRKIMAYSSTAHLGWIIIIIQYTPHLAVLTLGIYVFMTMTAFLTLKATSSTKINMLAQSWSKNPVMATIMLLILLSLAGLPPLTGFLPKWLILEELTKQAMTALATLIAMSALLSLYFYMRLCYSSTLTLFPSMTMLKISWRRFYTKKAKILLPTATAVALILLPLAPLITALTRYYS
uniref:NADH-ubiquinone oxidoreductase chain 2 n=2 Tax=Characoidei TaxID=1489739 RepID=A0A8F9R4U4_9TELE|nr:NADH dehydrogenase subunit 2 [Gephyrocharax atracaudatus]QCQ81476.1 NADH dehydrogenase subunit 2 [Gephyrocharax atracaudatus]QYJ09236.1 NADH dehydrogenase subunit 2 [Gymnocorymbus ternetzi]